MSVFQYQAVNLQGKRHKGLIEADSARQARQLLREQGLLAESVHETRSATDNPASVNTLRWQRGISASELALLTRQLATLVQAAMPLEECLRAVAEQCEKNRLKSLMLAVRTQVLEGHTLADSLRAYPLVFDELFCAMVAAGEKAGHLDAVLSRLADYTEQRQYMKGKLLQAMIYPLVLTVVAIGVIAILLASVVPKVVAQFDHLGQALPHSTQLLIALSDGVRDYGLWLVGALLVLGVLVQRLLRQPALRLRWDRFWLRLPLLGKVSRGLNTARFARTLSILSSSSVPLLEGMQIAASVASNRYVRSQILTAAERVREGSSLRAALGSSGLFPPMMLHMIASGERSGELEPMLLRAADNQDREFEALVTLALGIFEPLLIVSMAGVVLFIVVAILQPMLQLNNMVGL
ncbi:type II secretion system inner membrane protein GspF [Plesiomonas shigelloides]|uniref:type II secretion system inner membrane protein GspF n=1 Tax=Plesiomonas shigelloides TaxID=703 RepID=UPI001C5AB180|nr:type II secretion system inner membrane protein GspF [Plesiomonas shigelloides]MBW3792473.1 type II secretion system inner membrane protein GspF [Plesiomonas shigelloides]